MPPTIKRQVAPKPTVTMSSSTPTLPPNNPAGSVLERIAPIAFSDDDGIKILLYGRSGTGKTTLWGSFPKPIMVAIVSGGNKPGELRTLDTPELQGHIHQVVLQTPDELKVLTEYVSQQSYKTFVLDHASGLQDLVLGEIIGKPVPEQKTWGLATQQQYGQCTLQCKELLRGMLGLNTNVVIIAQEREFNNDGDPASLILPFVGAGLSPSLTGWLNTAVDYICQTFIRQKTEIITQTIGTGKNAKEMSTRKLIQGAVEFCLRTAPDPVYTTKFRIPKGLHLPPEIVDPTFDKILALIKGR